MSSAKDIAKGFTISGLLDDASRTRKSYPVFEIDLAAIEDHPGNSVYSMDETAIARLTESIRKQGLTDLPLVRKLESGAYQMVSGHRRKAAYTLLAATDPAFEKLPCRVIEGVTDEESVTLLHAANYFTRSLTRTERAAATRALGVEVERRRAEDDTLTGVRTEDVKAAILQEQTGRKVSGKTIKRQEALAELVETRLIPAWRAKADASLLSASSIETIAALSEEWQVELYDGLPEDATSKASVSKYVEDALATDSAKAEELERERELAILLRETIHPHTDTRLRMALGSLKSYLENPPEGTQEPDLRASAILRCLSDHLPKPASKAPKKTASRLRHA